MIYEQYRAKIKKWAKVWATIKRFRVLILSVLITVTATVTGLLVARGTVYGTTDMPSVITYGDGFTYKAKSFMSKVSYEYSLVSSDEWTDEIPNVPGTYRVRAVTKAAFGGKRYGKAQQFTLQPKPVSLSVAQSELVYGNAPTLIGDLIQGDRAVCSEYAYTGIGTDTVTVQAKPQYVRIYTQDGRDVTGCYSVQTVEKSIAFTARPITLEVTDATHVYDGTEFFSEAYTVSDGSLAFADEISALFPARVTDYTAQPIENTATFSISNADGVNVTQYYDITAVSGTLTVEKRPLFIQTETHSKPYDGTPLSAADLAYTYDGLVDGQTIAIKDGTANWVIKTGSVQNAFTPVITDGAGNETTGNYEYSFPEDSMLTITPRDLTIKSKAVSKTYDGTPLTCEEFATNGLIGIVEGDDVKATFTGTITNAGEAMNDFTVDKIVSENEMLGDVTDCYIITPQYGTLTVEKRTIKVVTSTLEKVYDGTVLQEKGVDGDYANLIQVDEANGCYGLVTGHRLIAKTYYNSIKDVQWVGEGDNKEVTSVENKIDFLVSNAEIDKNYDIQCTYGTLKITPRPITVKSEGLDEVYNGQPYTNANYDYLKEEDNAGLLESLGHSITATFTGSQTNAYDENNETQGYGASDNLFTIKIASPENDVTKNYEITYVYGILKVTPRLITITAESRETVYSGETQKIEKDPLVKIDNLVSWHTLSGVKTMGGSGINAGEYPHEINHAETVVCIKDGDNEVTKNYQISFEDGKLIIKQRAVYIVTQDVRWLYDGNEHYDGDGIEYTYKGVTYKNDGEVSFKTGVIDGVEYYELEKWQELEEDYAYRSTKTDVLWKNGEVSSQENKREFRIVGEDADNYTIKYEYGTMTIDPRPITVKSLDAHKVYDGTPLTKTEWNVVISANSPYDFVDGQNGVAIGSAWGSQTNANAEFGKIKYDLTNNTFELTVQITATGEDITSNYDITPEYGSLTVQKRPLLVTTTHDCTWTYDGEEHWDNTSYTNDDLTYDNDTYYSLVDGHSLYIDTFTKVRFYIDSGTDNELTFKVRKGNDDINANYTITVKACGKLTIKKRPIYIQGTHTIEWIYDGKTHYDGDGQSASYGDGQSALYGNDDLSDEGYELVEGDSLIIATQPNARPHATYVWDKDIVNELTFTVTDNQRYYDGKKYEGNYADNYDIKWAENYYYGTLTIAPRKIYVEKTHDCTWTYDGEVHYDGDGKGNTVAYGNNDLVIDTEYYSLVGNDTLIIATPEDERSVTYVWDSVANELTFTVQAGNYRGSEDYTENYDIRQPDDYGTLTIKARPITIVTNDGTWVYDGLKHYDETTYSNADVINGTMVKEDYISLLTSDEQKVRVKSVAYSEKENVLTFTVIGNYVGEHDYADNYKISYEYGKLNITPRPIWISTGSASKIYDGTPLVKNESEYQIEGDGVGLLESLGHTIVINVTGTRTDVGKSDNTCEVTISDENEFNVNDNYAIVEGLELGTLEVTGGKVVIGLKELWKYYDGTPLAYTDKSWWIIDSNLPEDWDVDLAIEGLSLTKVGALTPEILRAYLTITDENGNIVVDDGENFTVEFRGDPLRIEKRKITLTAKTIAKVFDGEELTGGNTADITFGTLAAGHRLQVVTQGEQLYPGSSENVIIEYKILDAGGNDVTDNYEVDRRPGILTVLEDE